jgi:hypothetical protein
VGLGATTGSVATAEGAAATISGFGAGGSTNDALESIFARCFLAIIALCSIRRRCFSRGSSVKDEETGISSWGLECNVDGASVCK